MRQDSGTYPEERKVTACGNRRRFTGGELTGIADDIYGPYKAPLHGRGAHSSFSILTQRNVGPSTGLPVIS